jgi:cupin 2 domain-containing protein
VSHAAKPTNLFEAVPVRLPAELAETICRGEGVRIERIVSRGHASPAGFWYDQDEHEFVVLLAGRAGLQFEGEPAVRLLHPGDYLHIPPHVRHRVAWTDGSEDTLWLAVFYR